MVLDEHVIYKARLRLLIDDWRDEIINETPDGNIRYKNGRVDGLKEAIEDVEELIEDET